MDDDKGQAGGGPQIIATAGPAKGHDRRFQCVTAVGFHAPDTYVSLEELGISEGDDLDRLLRVGAIREVYLGVEGMEYAKARGMEPALIDPRDEIEMPLDRAEPAEHDRVTTIPGNKRPKHGTPNRRVGTRR